MLLVALKNEHFKKFLANLPHASVSALLDFIHTFGACTKAFVLARQTLLLDKIFLNYGTVLKKIFTHNQLSECTSVNETFAWNPKDLVVISKWLIYKLYFNPTSCPVVMSFEIESLFKKHSIQTRKPSRTKLNLTLYNTYRYSSKDKLPNVPFDIDEIWLLLKVLKKSWTKVTKNCFILRYCYKRLIYYNLWGKKENNMSKMICLHCLFKAFVMQALKICSQLCFPWQSLSSLFFIPPTLFKNFYFRLHSFPSTSIHSHTIFNSWTSYRNELKQKPTLFCNSEIAPAAWLSGQSWGFECGKAGLKPHTQTTKRICPRWSQGQTHHTL